MFRRLRRHLAADTPVTPVEPVPQAVTEAPGTSPLSPRVQSAVEFRREHPNDFYGGWEEEDIALFQSARRSSTAQPGTITDFLGTRTATGLHPWAAWHDGAVFDDLPIPDDQLRAEAIEYFALLHAFDRAGPDSFTIAELGASFGPWVCAAAVEARHRGVPRVRLTAVEASHLHFEQIQYHLATNGVSFETAELNLVHGAIATEAGTLYFPKVHSLNDNGSQAVETARDHDYIGREVEHEAVTAYTLDQVLAEGITDLLHVDIQGTEGRLLSANIDLLDARVRTMFIGTHSRRIEGELLDLLHGRGWILVRERPCQFSYRTEIADITGWTTRDGGQVWTNPRLDRV